MSIPHFSWRQEPQITADMQAAYQRDGVLLIEDAISAAECERLITRMSGLVDGFDSSEHRSVFSAVTNEQQDDRYFLESGGEIRFFFEKDAFDERGQPRAGKHELLNKVGHALHDLDPVFDAFSRQHKFERLVKALGMQDPKLLQSMYLFKQPRIGGEVLCHQDSPFLWTEPQSCIGLWFALEDATLENGCLWGIPGQHKEATPRSRLVRKSGDRTELDVLDPRQWPEEERVPLAVEAGTLVVLHGQFPHLSGPNNSDRSRHAYALHLIDGRCHYPAQNWLQRGKALPLRGF
jgi:phytanoyl-CoA hydroxylase